MSKLQSNVGHEAENILVKLKQMSETELDEYLSKTDNEALIKELIKVLLFWM